MDEIEVEETALKRLQAIRTKLRQNQKGFTLIEMLVVISILGILAAVVTMSLVGVTSYAKNNALRSERATVQSAVDAYASQNNKNVGDICPAGPTNHMNAFLKDGGDLSPTYLHTEVTQQNYSCDVNGVVSGDQTGTN